MLCQKGLSYDWRLILVFVDFSISEGRQCRLIFYPRVFYFRSSIWYLYSKKLIAAIPAHLEAD